MTEPVIVLYGVNTGETPSREEQQANLDAMVRMIREALPEATVTVPPILP